MCVRLLLAVFSLPLRLTVAWRVTGSELCGIVRSTKKGRLDPRPMRATGQVIAVPERVQPAVMAPTGPSTVTVGLVCVRGSWIVSVVAALVWLPMLLTRTV